MLKTQAIINAYNNTSYSRIKDNVKAIIFIGTPHRGADLAALLGNVLTVTLSRKPFVDQLRSDSESIQEINNLFRDRTTSLDLVSFYESLGIHGLGVRFLDTKV